MAEAGHPVHGYELLYRTVLAHWRRSHCEGEIALQELSSLEQGATGVATATALYRVLYTQMVGALRCAMSRWALSSLRIQASEEIQRMQQVLQTAVSASRDALASATSGQGR